MATVEKRGESYRIVASAGYGADGKQIRKRMTWTPRQGMNHDRLKKSSTGRLFFLHLEQKNNGYD
jgi:integrase